MSIRHRLLVWHTTVFAVGLLVFALVIWWGMREAIYRDLDRWLGAQADGLERFLANEVTADGPERVAMETREFSVGMPAASGVQLFDRSGKLLAGKPGAGRHVNRDLTLRGLSYRYTLWRSTENAEASLQNLTITLLVLTPIFLVFSVAGGWWLSRRALRPVDDVTEAARTVSLQNLSMRLPVPPHGDELQRLSLAWNEMLGRLEDSTRRLTQFTADASHELRTPVAVIRTAAEIALRHDRSPAEYREVLGKIRGQSEDITATIENLMELARADSGQARFVFAPVDVSSVIAEVRDQVLPLAAARGLDLNIHLPQGHLLIAGDRAALRRLLLILLDNAMKFTPAPGRIALDLRAVDEGVLLEVADTGIGIGHQDTPHIFDRFFQSDRARTQGGSGLGLSLAQWLAQGHRGRIEVESQLGSGATFRVYFPAL